MRRGRTSARGEATPPPEFGFTGAAFEIATSTGRKAAGCASRVSSRCFRPIVVVAKIVPTSVFRPATACAERETPASSRALRRRCLRFAMQTRSPPAYGDSQRPTPAHAGDQTDAVPHLTRRLAPIVRSATIDAAEAEQVVARSRSAPSRTEELRFILGRALSKPACMWRTNSESRYYQPPWWCAAKSIRRFTMSAPAVATSLTDRDVGYDLALSAPTDLFNSFTRSYTLSYRFWWPRDPAPASLTASTEVRGTGRGTPGGKGIRLKMPLLMSGSSMRCHRASPEPVCRIEVVVRGICALHQCAGAFFGSCARFWPPSGTRRILHFRAIDEFWTRRHVS